jgi:hypothetical protein
MLAAINQKPNLDASCKAIRLAEFGRRTALDIAIHCASMSSVSAGQQSNGQVTTAPVILYGLEGSG